MKIHQLNYSKIIKSYWFVSPSEMGGIAGSYQTIPTSNPGLFLLLPKEEFSALAAFCGICFPCDRRFQLIFWGRSCEIQQHDERPGLFSLTLNFHYQWNELPSLIQSENYLFLCLCQSPVSDEIKSTVNKTVDLMEQWRQTMHQRIRLKPSPSISFILSNIELERQHQEGNFTNITVEDENAL